MADPEIISDMTLRIYCKNESPKGNKFKLELCKSRENFLEKNVFYEWNQKDDSIYQVKYMTNILAEMHVSILKFC